ncbi:Phospholipid-transporting ATPase 1 [Hordeum vulgare]|nr:Phospholipid-transporting ATPase 1 [Hordeum vulgare]
MQGGEAAVVAAFATAAQQEDTKAAKMEALLYLGINPSQHGLVNAVVVAATVSTGSSACPRMMLPESPHASCTQPIPGFHVYLQGSRFSGEFSPEVIIMAPSTPASVNIDLNAASVAGRSSSGGMRKRKREMLADMLTGARNLFDGMPVAVDDDTTNRLLENMIFEGAPATGAYDPDETQSQDGREPFTQATNDPHDASMQDKVGLDGFPLDHEFSEDYDLEEEDDDMDIDGEPFFEEEVANQTAAGVKPKRKSKRTKAYTPPEDKLLSFEAFKVQHDGKAFHLAHCWTIINGEEKFKAQYAALLTRGGKEVVHDHGNGKKALPLGKTNMKKEDRHDTASIALLENLEGVIRKMDLREEKRRQEKEEQLHAFMEIQRRRLEMDAERQTKMLELEEAKQPRCSRSMPPMPGPRRKKWPSQA